MYDPLSFESFCIICDQIPFDLLHQFILEISDQEILSLVSLRILTGKNHSQINLQRLQKVGTWAFGSLVHQISSS